MAGKIYSKVNYFIFSLIALLQSLFESSISFIKKINQKYKLDLVLVLVILLASIIPIIAMVPPVYFKDDDVIEIYWAKNHMDKPLIVFSNSEEKWFDPSVNRPLYALEYIYFYRFFGLNPFLWQLVHLVFFVGAFVYLYRLGKMLYSKMAGFFSVALWFICFYSLTKILLWISVFVKSMTIFFLASSVFYFVRGINKKSKLDLFLGFILMIIGTLHRETVMGIVPPTVIFYFLYKKYKENWFTSSKIIITVTIFLFGILACINLPFYRASLAERFSNTEFTGQITHHFLYYLNFLCSGLNSFIIVSILICAIYIAFSKNIINISPLTIVYLLVLSNLLLLLFPAIRIWSVLALTVFYFFFADINQKTMAVWFIIGFLILLPIPFFTTSYFLEGSIGFALFLGLTLSLIILKLIKSYEVNKKNINTKIRFPKHLGTLLVVLLILVVIISSLFFVPKSNLIKDVNKFKAVCRDFKITIDYMAEELPKDCVVYGVDSYSVLDEQGDIYLDKYGMNLKEYLWKNKLMEVRTGKDDIKNDLYLWFDVLKRPDINVVGLKEFNASLSKNQYIFAMNQWENDLVLSWNVSLIPSKTTENAFVYKILS